MEVVTVTDAYETLYGMVAGTNDPVPASSYLEPADETGLTAQTGPIGDQILTGTCLQSPEASAQLGEGIDPITGASLDSYDDVVTYLEAVPDSLAVLADQFGHSGMTDGTVYIVQEDAEWPTKIKEQLDTAGIAYNEQELEADVATAYDQVIDRFETYVTDVLDNDVSTTIIKTSEISEMMDTYIDLFKEEHGITADEGLYERICLLTSPFGMDCIEDIYGMEQGTLDMIDPPRHHPYLFDIDADVSNIFAEASQDYLETHDVDHQIGLTYPLPDAVTSDSHGHHLDTSHLSEDPLAASALLVPGYEESIDDLVVVQQSIDDEKELLKTEAETVIAEEAGVASIDMIFEQPASYDLAYWGEKVSETMADLKEEKGIIGAKQQLQDKLQKDLALLQGDGA